MWTKGAHYLKKMGGVILVASLVIWALSGKTVTALIFESTLTYSWAINVILTSRRVKKGIIVFIRLNFFNNAR
jgi:Fe2+ transport system protein B